MNEESTMNFIVDFSEAKAKHDGVHTPKAVLENALEHVEDISEIVLLIRKKDEQVIHGMSDMNSSKAIGLCELGKVLIINDMWEEI